jgi:hypothetical protein
MMRKSVYASHPKIVEESTKNQWIDKLWLLHSKLNSIHG